MKRMLLLSLSLAGLLAQAQPFDEFSPRDIQPRCWLREYLQRQEQGLTGHPEALSYPYNTCLWDGEIPRMGTHGSEWWRYEQTAYYTDGLLRLGYILDDEALIRKGEAGVRYTLAHPQENGRLGNAKIESLWPMAVFFRAMQAAYNATQDPAIPAALERHYLSIPTEELIYGRNILNLEGMLWTAEKTGNRALVERADSAYRYKELTGKTIKWYHPVNPEFLRDDKPYYEHGVTVCESMKLPILLYQATGDESYRSLAVESLERLMAEDLLPDGVITSAEHLQGRGILHSHESCDITDFSWTLGYFLEVTGDARYADCIEKAVFNAGMGAVTPDWKALQYFSSVNQFWATGTSNHNAFKHGSTWMAYRPTHETECCAGNIHRFMPNYAARMWLRSEDGVVAALYGPSALELEEGFRLVETTDYPYDERIRITVEAGHRKRFTLRLRIPAWCEGARLQINGKACALPLEAGSYAEIRRNFRNGDFLELQLPMPVRREISEGGGVYFEQGPLLLSYAIPARWERDETVYANMNGKYPDNPDFPCWSICPEGAWNYAVLPDTMPVPGPDGQWLLPVVPIDWPVQEAGMTPDLPQKAAAAGPIQYLTLRPYGQTQLRLTVFPQSE